MALKKLGDTPNNIQSCIDGETFEVEEMYPVYNEEQNSRVRKEAQITTHGT